MNHRPILLSLTTMHKDGLQYLEGSDGAADGQCTRSGDLAARDRRCDALIIRTGGVVDAALLDRGDKLKVVGRHGVGYDQIDVDAATARGIQVVYTPGANTQSVAEHVFALMIGLSRHFPRMSAGLIAGNYHVRTSLTGREIAGKTLGIIGFGRIGRLVGEIGHRGFGMKILYHDIVPAPPEVEARSNARRTSLDEVLESFRVRHAARAARLEYAPHDQPRNAGPDALRRDPSEHLPRPGRRRGGCRRSPGQPSAVGLRRETCSPSSRRLPATR